MTSLLRSPPSDLEHTTPAASSVGSHAASVDFPARDLLLSKDCWEPNTDQVAGQPPVTAFKQRARLHQCSWRESQGYPAGTQPYHPTKGHHRAMGNRLEYAFATTSRRNVITSAARAAAAMRVATLQDHQMLNTDRLWCDLLSSMPLCFNLFGPLSMDLDLAQQAVSAWFPDAPGRVTAVHLEWSPGRLDPHYLGNRTAFDSAIELDLGDGTFGIIGVETKYHEHLHPEPLPSRHRLARYEQVALRSYVFSEEAPDRLIGMPLQQIWQDHLLALAMLQHPDRRWAWARFVLAYPAANPSVAEGASAYGDLLENRHTYQALTLESLLDNPHALPGDLASALRTRYLW